MNAEDLLAQFNRLADAPDAVAHLRGFILDLAVRGKLVKQDLADEPASELLTRIADARVQMLMDGEIRRPRNLSHGTLAKSFEIPSSWRWCRLDAIGAIIGGGTPASTVFENFAEPGKGIPWLTPADLSGYTNLYIKRGARDLSEKGLKSSSATLMPSETVLFTSRAPIGYIAIADNSISTNQGFKSIVPYMKECSRFIAIVMRAFAPEIDAKAPGTTFKEVSGKIVSGIPFPLPPLSEQHRIVTKVDELMTLCDQLETKHLIQERARNRLTVTGLSQLSSPDVDTKTFHSHARFTVGALSTLTKRSDQINHLRRTILELAVCGKLAKQDPEDEPASELLERITVEKERLIQEGKIGIPKNFSTNNLDKNPFPIPKGWIWCRITELGAINPRNNVPDDHMASFVSMPMIASEYGVPHKHEPRAWGKIKKGYTHFAEGDVGLAKITPCFENGKSTVFSNLTGGVGSGTTELYILRPLFVNTYYILLFFKSPYFIETGIPVMTGTAGQKRIPPKYFANSPFPLPPLAEQDRIVAKIDELMALCDRLEGSLDNVDIGCQHLLESLLQNALLP